MKRKIVNYCFMWLLIFCCFVTVGCKSDTVDPNPGGDDGGGGGGGGDEDPVFDFQGQNFTIMVDTVSSVDPRDSGYQKLFQAEKKAAIAAVEKKYNLKVKYVAYPSEASWGGARERYIINKSVSGLNDVHIYEIPSYSIGTLAVAKAISPLTTYIEKYGVKGYWKEAQAFSTAMGETYGYSDTYPLADEGIYYNMDLLEQYLGKGKGDLPSKMWLDGTWAWEAFESMCATLDEAMPTDNYVMGGMTYNWAYQMLGANGVHVVDNTLHCELATQAGIDTITYLNKLYNTYRWDATTPTMANATSSYMVQGKVAFHNGQSYWIFQSNKWLDKDFNIGFVPYPVGPNVKDTKNLTDYYINDIYGKTQFCISSGFAKDKIPAGYEDSTLYDEIIFKIWNELQYFPAVDEATGYVDSQPYIDEYETSRLGKYYGSDSSVQAHLSVIKKAYPDYFYSLDESKSQDGESYMVKIQSSIKGSADDIRSSMISLCDLVQNSFKTKYNLPEDYYTKGA